MQPTKLIWDGEKIYMLCGEDKSTGHRVKKIAGTQEFGYIKVYSYTTQQLLALITLKERDNPMMSVFNDQFMVSTDGRIAYEFCYPNRPSICGNYEADLNR